MTNYEAFMQGLIPETDPVSQSFIQQGLLQPLPSHRRKVFGDKPVLVDNSVSALQLNDPELKNLDIK
jgi:hypothetical protein